MIRRRPFGRISLRGASAKPAPPKRYLGPVFSCTTYPRSLLRLPSHRAHRLVATAVAAGLGALALSGVAGAAVSSAPATAGPLTILVSGNGPAFSTHVDIACESPSARDTGDVQIGGAATAARRVVAVAAGATARLEISDLTDGSACSVTTSGSGAAHLDAVDGGTPLIGSDGQIRGVAVTVDRGTPVTAHLTLVIPAAINAAVDSPRATTATTSAAGSGSAASTPPALPGSDGAASAAAPVALAAARSTTTASSAALPDPSGTGTALAISCVGLLLCAVVAYALVISSRREPRAN